MDASKNPNLTIKEAKRFLKKNKGIDLLILGIGKEHDPHIAYNTKGQSKLQSSIRVVRLHPRTIKKISVRAPHRGAPIYGITIGIKEILQANKILLLAYGKDKAKSIELALKRKVNINKVPASALQLHNDLYVVIDKALASKITV